jgi:hypothetical protein
VTPELSEKQVTVLVTEDHTAVLEPAVPVLEPYLSYRRKQFVAGGPLGHREVEQEVAFYDIDIMGRLVFSAGLLPRMRRVLREHGYKVRVEDRRQPGPRLRTDPEVLAEREHKHSELLHALAREPLGQVEAGTENDALEKVLLVVQLFPEAQCVLAVPTRKEAWRYWRKLGVEFKETVGLAVSGTLREGNRLLVGTFQSVPKKMAGEFDILVLPHGEQSTGEKACEMVAEMQFRRRYAFVRPQRRADWLVQIRLEQMAGPVIHRVKRPRVPVRVIMVPAPACKVGSHKTPLERKRALYWHNEVRNMHAARVARAVHSLDRATLKDVGLRNRDIRAIKRCDRARIRLLVETPEHARELLALLPGWRMGSLNQPGKDGTEKAGEVNFEMPVIMTAMYAATHDIRAHIVINAAGTAWPLKVKNFPPRQSDKTPPEVLVIDFDDHEGVARRDAQSRIKEYERQGMEVHVLQARATGVSARNSSAVIWSARP